VRTGRRLLTCLGAALIVYCGVVVDACGGTPSPSPTPALTLTVTKNGTGSGTVTSSPSGIACGATCSQGYPSGTAVTLTATPDADSVFAGWTGGSCSGTGTCPVVVTAATAVTATFVKAPYVGPYTVKQTQTQGGEVLSGGVCKITTPFVVTVAAPAVTFTFTFIPASATNGAWTYAYSIPSAGETHSASGVYSIGLPAPDGTLVLSMTGTDNVAFPGFSGPFPVNYQFSLVPSNFGPCP
jgi:Divergent InlB B-repeat domain